MKRNSWKERESKHFTTVSLSHNHISFISDVASLKLLLRLSILIYLILNFRISAVNLVFLYYERILYQLCLSCFHLVHKSCLLLISLALRSAISLTEISMINYILWWEGNRLKLKLKINLIIYLRSSLANFS